MSSNNIIIIEQQKDQTFIGYDKDIEHTDWKCASIFTARNEREAIEEAQAYQKDGLVEYGYFFKFLPKL